MKSNFPIKMIKENVITRSTGSATYLYEVFPPDLEQMPDDTLDDFLKSIKDWACHLSANSFVRIFYLSGRIFINCDHDFISIPSCKIIKAQNFQEMFFGMSDLYSNPTVVGGDTLVCNLLQTKMINLYSMPPHPDVCELARYGDFVINLKKLEPGKAKSRLDIKRKIHFSNTQKHIRDIESEASYSESESILEGIIHGVESLFNVEAWVLVRVQGNTRDIVKEAQNILAQMELRGYRGFVETLGLSVFWKENFFFMPPRFVRSHLATSSYLVNLLPLSVDKLHQDGVAFQARSGAEVKINLNSKEADNNNVLVSGRSGSGKSFAINKVIFEELKNGAKAIILDYNASFLRNTLYNGGNSFAKSFNPMMFSDPSYLKALILAMVDPKDFDLKAQGKLFSEIKQILQDTPEISFSDLIARLEKTFTGIGYFFEEFWEYFSDEKVQSADITFVDLSKYPDRVLPALIVFLIELFKSMDGRRIFVFEECWNILSHASDFVVQFFRTFRKEGATAIAISQSFEDFIRSDMGRVVAENSYHKLIFRQDLRVGPFVSDFDVKQVGSLSGNKGIYSEFYYKSEMHSKCVRYFGTPLEYTLFNTTKEDSDAINKYISKYIDDFEFKKIIHSYLAIEYAQKI